jgi:hypothetical protein
MMTARARTIELSAEPGTTATVLRLPCMPIEFFQDRPLEPEELDDIRRQIEGLAKIDAIDPEIRGIVERNWPHLVAKLPPEDDDEPQ